MHMHVETLRMHTLASMRMLAFRNLNFHYFDSPFHLFPYPTAILMFSFHHFVGLAPFLRKGLF